MKEIPLKMAKATPEDLEAAMLLNGMLSDVCDDDQFPRGLDGEFSESDPDHFDEDDSDHLRAFYDRLKEVYRRRPGGMNRVIWGMDCIMDKANRIVDPDKDHLAPHPAIRWVEEDRPQVVTCVYCGHEYPDGTPAAKQDLLTAHIKVCEKHPMREAEARIERLRKALAGLIGAETREELEAIEVAVRMIPGIESDKIDTINAIHALLGEASRKEGE